jgi:hypothetical protein
VVVPDRYPKVAVMVEGPGFMHVASPFEPDILLIVATFVSEEFQVASVVMFCMT